MSLVVDSASQTTFIPVQTMNSTDDSANTTESDSDKTNANMVLKINIEKLPSLYDQEEEKTVNQFRSSPNPSTTLTMSNKLESSINQILPRLYLGDDFIARNLNFLREKKITHILNLTINIPNKFEPEIVYLKLTIFDYESQNISQFFDEAIEFISEALKNEKNSVLVHCNAGVSRSTSFVIAYLMKKCNYKTYKQAYAHVKKCRPIIAPNRGFEKQLIQLERMNKRKCIIM